MSKLPPNIEVLSSLDAKDDGFDVSDERQMAALSAAEDRHFWHVARNELIEERLRRLGVAPPATFLDVGCGGGCVSAHLERAGYRLTGVDGHLPRLREAAARAPRAHFYLHDLRGGAGALPAGFGAAGLFDVIEHLDDPAGAIREAASRVAPGGFVVGTVPALMALWSGVDVGAGHRLRYDAAGLEALLRSVAEVEVREVVYFNRLLVAPIWLRRRAQKESAPADLGVPPAPVNALLIAALRADRAAFARLPRVPGASLWFAVQTRAGDS